MEPERTKVDFLLSGAIEALAAAEHFAPGTFDVSVGPYHLAMPTREELLLLARHLVGELDAALRAETMRSRAEWRAAYVVARWKVRQLAGARFSHFDRGVYEELEMVRDLVVEGRDQVNGVRDEGLLAA